MLNSLKQTSKTIGYEISRDWEQALASRFK